MDPKGNTKGNAGRGRGRGRASAPVAIEEATARARTHLTGRGRGKAATANDGAQRGETITAGPGRGRGKAATASAGPQRGETITTGRGRGRAATANNGQQRGEGASGGVTDTTEVKIETVVVPGRGGRQQSAEKYPFSALTPAKKEPDGSLIGPSFLIAEADKPDNILAAARKRHKGKTFISRKMDNGVRIWLKG